MPLTNAASQWRFALGYRIGMSYAANPKARVVMIAGSTGRGTADRYSDLELEIYWSEPPTDEDRRTAAERGGGALLDLSAYEEEEWAESIDVGGFHLHTSTFLIETIERCLREVLEQYSTDPFPQMRLYSLLHAEPLAGQDLVEEWRSRAADYPSGLTRAMLDANLPFDGLGNSEDVLIGRDDLLPLYDLVGRVERQVLGILLGLNGIYLPHDRFKRTDELIGEMANTPRFLADRLKAAFRLPPEEGIETLHAICEETLALVETHVPDFPVDNHRADLRQRRGVWDQSPEGSL